MSIDWDATGSMLSGLGTWATLGVVGLGAWRALATYRIQRAIDREFDAVERVLSAAYRARDAIEAIRPRWVDGHESASAEKELAEANDNWQGLSEHQRRAYVQRRVIYRRAELYKEDFTNLFDVMPTALIYFGSEVESKVRNLARARQKIFVASDILPDLSEETSSENREFIKKLRQTIYGTASDAEEADEVTVLVRESVDYLEKTLTPRVRLSGRAEATQKTKQSA